MPVLVRTMGNPGMIVVVVLRRLRVVQVPVVVLRVVRMLMRMAMLMHMRVLVRM
jgi:hypothetical protein